MSNVTLNVSLPIDSDGFLRRRCPYCKRHFKLIYKSAEDEEAEEEGQQDMEESLEELFCPYCGQSAGSDSFWTDEQIRYMHEIANQKIVHPMLDDFANELERMGRKNGFIKIEAEKTEVKKPVISPEPNDMVKVKSDCCGEDMKIEEDWERPIHCAICGKTQSS